MADDDQDYSQFGYQTQSQDLPTGDPGGSDTQAMGGNTGSYSDLANTQQALPAGNPGAPEWQLPVVNRGAVPVQNGGTGDIPPLPAQQHTAPVAAILAYLHGDGAADPQTVASIEQQVDPDGSMDDGERHLRAIQLAHQQGGPEAAWSFVQANRQAYNAKMAFAQAALRGTQQKPPDIAAAAQAATDAYSHVPDGNSIVFQPSQTMQGGVTATVMPKDGAPQSRDLSPDQFAGMIDIGKDGLFDKVYQTGYATLGAPIAAQNIDKPVSMMDTGAVAKQSTGRNNAPVSADDDTDESQGTPTGAPGSVKAPTVYTGEAGSRPVPRDVSRGRSPSFGTSGSDTAAGYDPQLVAQANRIFRTAGQAQQKEQWLAKMQDQWDTFREANKNKVDVANAGNIAKMYAADQRVRAADVGGTHRENAALGAAEIRSRDAQIAQANRMAIALQQSGNNQLATAMRGINGWRNDPANYGKALPPQMQDVVDTAMKLAARTQPQGNAPTQSAVLPAPQQAVRTATGPNGQKLYLRNGQWVAQ